VGIERGRISSSQAVALIATIVGPTAILTGVTPLIAQAKQDAWIGGLLLILYGIVIVWLAAGLTLRFPGKTLLEIVTLLLGRPARWLLGGLYTWWLLHVTAVIVREMGEFALSAMLPRTPIMVIMGSLLVVVVFAVRGGLEVIARATQFVFPLMPLLIMGIILLAFPDFQLENLLPLLQEGFRPIVQGAFPLAGFFGEFVVAALAIFPFVADRGGIIASGILAVVLIGLFTILAAVSSIALLGPALAAQQTFPFVRVVRFVALAEFLERLDPMLILAWFFGIAIKVMIWFYALVLTAAHWLNLSDYRPLTFPFAVIVLGLAQLLHDSVTDLSAFIVTTWTPYATVFELLIPFGLWLLSSFQARPDPSTGLEAS